jgi:hypothetical protein
MRLSLRGGKFISCFTAKHMIAFPLFSISATHPAHLTHLDLLIRIKFGESIKLLPYNAVLSILLLVPSS